ncbi:MAG: PaaI family thioesterase [Chloroflexi bacterium]|nr:MAG: PaaI family thioesterase [Chloroflexota bacterium]
MKRTRTVTWEDPFEVPKAAAGRSGLDLLKDVFEGRLPPPPITATLGFRGVHVEEGKAVFEGEPGEHLYNPIGSLELKTNFVRPITVETGRVRCEGVVVHRGATIATAEGKLVADSTGKLLAHGTTTCLIVSPP